MTTIASRLAPPKPIRRQWRHLRRHARHSWERYLKWPAPLWRARGYARLGFEGHEFTFGIDNLTLKWADKVRRGKWEPNTTAFLVDALRPGDVFVDVGAWVGPISLLASRLVQPDGRVYAFEPDPVARRLLKRNIGANKATNITVLPYGVTDERGRAWIASGRLGNSQSAVNPNEGTVEIQTVTLDGFCAEQGIHPAAIKIDVEGGEARVLAGGEAVLRGARAIVLEIHDPQLRALGVDPIAFRRSVDSLGKETTVLHQRPDAGNLNLGLLEPSLLPQLAVAAAQRPGSEEGR